LSQSAGIYQNMLINQALVYLNILKDEEKWIPKSLLNDTNVTNNSIIFENNLSEIDSSVDSDCLKSIIIVL